MGTMVWETTSEVARLTLGVGRHCHAGYSILRLMLLKSEHIIIGTEI